MKLYGAIYYSQSTDAFRFNIVVLEEDRLGYHTATKMAEEDVDKWNKWAKGNKWAKEGNDWRVTMVIPIKPTEQGVHHVFSTLTGDQRNV